MPQRVVLAQYGTRRQEKEVTTELYSPNTGHQEKDVTTELYSPNARQDVKKKILLASRSDKTLN